jgi:hypothetical protein
MFARNRWTSCAALFTALALLAGVSSISAQGQKAEEPEGTPQEIKATEDRLSAAERISTALFLIDFGRANKSPTALLTAVELIHRTPTKEGEGEDKNVAGAKPLSEQLPDLLAEAKKMRPDDRELATLADRVGETIKERPRDIVGATVSFERNLDPLDQFTTNTYTFQAVGGQITVSLAGLDVLQRRRLRLERINAANNQVVETHTATIGLGLAPLKDFFSVAQNQRPRYKFRISNLTTQRTRIRISII